MGPGLGNSFPGGEVGLTGSFALADREAELIRVCVFGEMRSQGGPLTVGAVGRY